MYISETASVHLGLPQIDLTGASIFDYIHPSDRSDICDIFTLNDQDQVHLAQNELDGSDYCELNRSFCVRMKCILPKRNAGLVNGGYKVIHCYGYLKLRSTTNANNQNCSPEPQNQQYHGTQEGQPSGQLHQTPNTSLSPISTTSTASSYSANTNSRWPPTSANWDGYALVAVGHSLLPTASTEVKLNGHSFMLRASLDMRLIHIEASASSLLSFELDEMVGQSLYQFVHPSDLKSVENSHRLVLDKGQAVTRYYRLVKKTGGFIWVQSHATLVANPRNTPKPQHIICVCVVISDEHYDDRNCVIYEKFDEKQNMSMVFENTPSQYVAKPPTMNISGLNPIAPFKVTSREHNHSNLQTSIGEMQLAASITKHQDTRYLAPITEHLNCYCSCVSACVSNSMSSSRRASDDSIVSSATSTNASSSWSSCSSLAGFYPTRQDQFEFVICEPAPNTYPISHSQATMDWVPHNMLFEQQ